MHWRHRAADDSGPGEQIKMPKLILKATKQLLQVEDKHYSADVEAHFTIGFTGT